MTTAVDSVTTEFEMTTGDVANDLETTTEDSFDEQTTTIYYEESTVVEEGKNKPSIHLIKH